MSAIGAVHILRRGFALCGFGEGDPPGKWPPGQKWVADVDANGATCQHCRAKLDAQAGSAQVEVMATSGAKLARFAVFSIRKDSRTGAAVWVRVGNAASNRDGSVNIHLDALPIDGKLFAKPEAGRDEGP